jgi:Flp pilus assembly protein TadD
MTKPQTALPYPDNLHLQGAVAWLELGNHLEAIVELAKISRPQQVQPLVLRQRCKIYAAAGRWELASKVARGITVLVPEDSFGWIHLAHALHELKRTNEAYAVAVSAAAKFAGEGTLPYNLACYACRLGKLREAMQWLEKAIDADGQNEVRHLALDDPDLEPLWPRISEI